MAGSRGRREVSVCVVGGGGGEVGLCLNAAPPRPHPVKVTAGERVSPQLMGQRVHPKAGDTVYPWTN